MVDKVAAKAALRVVPMGEVAPRAPVAVEASTRVRESSPRCFFESFFLWSSRGY